MFTGLVEKICMVRSIRSGVDSAVLAIDLADLAPEIGIGESIAISGVCLTVTGVEGAVVSFDVSAETLAKSALGRLSPSSEVNIERAIRATDRFGGHFVQGHIDGTAIIAAMDKHGEYADMTFTTDAELLGSMVVKGSVAVDGVSLTIANISQNGFTIAVIPETWKRTTLSRAQIGDVVNIETDIIVKTVKKQLQNILPKTEPLTAERLREMGF